MSRAQTKVLQYVKEARASELALVRVLQSQIAMTPRGTLRSGLEKHLLETRDHAERLRVRAGELEHGFNPVALAVGVAEAVTGQALALAKTPLDLVRGTGGEEKVLKNAKDSSATEALEIATYTALERLAELAGDTKTAELAADIRKDEEQMLGFLLEEIPTLTEAVFGADVDGNPSFDPAKTGAAETVRGAAGDAASSAADTAKGAAGKVADDAKDAADGARSAVKDAADDARNAADDVEDASGDAQDAGDDTPAVDPDAEKPWAGYDELSVEEVRAVLLTADAETVAQVDAYERANRNRKGILGVTEPQVQSA
jgi:ferritin-like metal-binding protein YciE